MQSGLLGLDEIISESMGLDSKMSQYMAEQYKKAGMDGVASGLLLESTVHQNHKKYIQILRKRLIIEYDAQSISERMLIDMSVSAYFRSLHTSQIYSALIMDDDGSISYNQLKINALKELTRHIESANRQFISSLAMLKDMKRPPINVKVHSRQAFIAQNQQFNKQT